MANARAPIRPSAGNLRRAIGDPRGLRGWVRFVEAPNQPRRSGAGHGPSTRRNERPDPCSLRASPRVARERDGHAGRAEAVAAQAPAYLGLLASFRRSAYRCGGVGAIGRIVVIAHGALARRQCTALIAVDGREPRDRVALAQCPRIDVETRAPCALDVDLRGGDPGRQLEAFRPRIGAGDRARQRDDLACPSGIVARRQIQAMAARILRRARLACGSSRTGAGARVAAVGIDFAQAFHDVSLHSGSGHLVTLAHFCASSAEQGGGREGCNTLHTTGAISSQ